VKTTFLYGVHDWMDRASADQLFTEGKLPAGSSVHTVPAAGHQHLNDNPIETAILTVGVVHGPERQTAYEQFLQQYVAARPEQYGREVNKDVKY